MFVLQGKAPHEADWSNLWASRVGMDEATANQLLSDARNRISTYGVLDARTEFRVIQQFF